MRIPASETNLPYDESLQRRRRDQGILLGFQAKCAIEKLHFLIAGAGSFARSLNETPKIAARLLVTGPWSSRWYLLGVWIREHKPATVDITGGAPEISEYFTYFVETARSVGSHVIDRNNLTIIETKSYAYLPKYLAKHEVEVIASLPCYSAKNVNAQRGDGVFDKSENVQ